MEESNSLDLDLLLNQLGQVGKRLSDIEVPGPVEAETCHPLVRERI